MEECKHRGEVAGSPRAAACCEGREPEGPRTVRYASLEPEALETLWAELGPRRLEPSRARDTVAPLCAAFPAESSGQAAACEPEEERSTLPAPGGEAPGVDEALSALGALSAAPLTLDFSDLDVPLDLRADVSADVLASVLADAPADAPDER